MFPIDLCLVEGRTEKELMENFKSVTAMPKAEKINLYVHKHIETDASADERNTEIAEDAFLLKKLKNDVMKMGMADLEAMDLHEGYLRQRRQCARLTSKVYDRAIDSGLKHFTKDISKIEVASRLSEELNCPVDKITDKDIEEKLVQDKREDADRRERTFQELLLEETEREKKEKASKHKKNQAKRNQQTKKSSKPLLEIPAAAIIPVAKPQSQAERRLQYSLGFYERPSIQEHPRVTKRWRTKNPEEIRNFEDISATGERIKRYEGLDESEIFYLRACHYLPALEKIFADGRDKKIYTFRTEKGVGMAAILHCDDQKHYGFINFGIGADGVLFHRFFEKTEPGRLFEAIKRTGSEVPIKDEEKWTFTSKYNFEVLKDGSIHVSYPDEEHAITIFPIRKDLLDKTLFNGA